MQEACLCGERWKNDLKVRNNNFYQQIVLLMTLIEAIEEEDEDDDEEIGRAHVELQSPS